MSWSFRKNDIGSPRLHEAKAICSEVLCGFTSLSTRSINLILNASQINYTPYPCLNVISLVWLRITPLCPQALWYVIHMIIGRGGTESRAFDLHAEGRVFKSQPWQTDTRVVKTVTVPLQNARNWDVGMLEEHFDSSLRYWNARETFWPFWDVGTREKHFDHSMRCWNAGETFWPFYEMLEYWRNILTFLWDVEPLEEHFDRSLRCWNSGGTFWRFYEMLECLRIILTVLWDV